MKAVEYCVESDGEGVFWEKANVDCDEVFCFKEKVFKNI
jgi:hypothetical protein